MIYITYLPLNGRANFTTPAWARAQPTHPSAEISRFPIEKQSALKCTLTPGADGGPWLLKYKSSTRLGYLNGVTSAFGDSDKNGRIDLITSPYFDGETGAVYKAAANVWSGSIAPKYGHSGPIIVD